MKKQNIKIAVMVISFVIFVAAVSIVLAVTNEFRQTEKTTTEFSATVENVTVTGPQDDKTIHIFVKEYTPYLDTMLCENEIPNANVIKDLKNGDKIFFRIKNADVEEMQNAQFLTIRSLHTEKFEIFSLSEYNESLKEFYIPLLLIPAFFALLSLTVLLICLFSAIRGRKEILKERSETYHPAPETPVCDEEVLFENVYLLDLLSVKESFFNYYFSRKSMVALYIILPVIFVVSLIVALVSNITESENIAILVFISFIALLLNYRRQRNLAVNRHYGIYGGDMMIKLSVTEDYIQFAASSGNVKKTEYGAFNKSHQTKRSIVLYSNSNWSVMFFKDSFIKGNKDDFITFLENKGVMVR